MTDLQNNTSAHLGTLDASTPMKIDRLPGIVAGEWKPERSGDYGADCATGRKLANDLLDVIRSDSNPAFFGTVVRAITSAGLFDGVEVGFCSVIGINSLA